MHICPMLSKLTLGNVGWVVHIFYSAFAGALYRLTLSHSLWCLSDLPCYGVTLCPFHFNNNRIHREIQCNNAERGGSRQDHMYMSVCTALLDTCHAGLFCALTSYVSRLKHITTHNVYGTWQVRQVYTCNEGYMHNLCMFTCSLSMFITRECSTLFLDPVLRRGEVNIESEPRFKIWH